MLSPSDQLENAFHGHQYFYDAIAVLFPHLNIQYNAKRNVCVQHPETGTNAS
jgi:hypothetical protein